MQTVRHIQYQFHKCGSDKEVANNTYNREAKDVPYINCQIRLGIVQIKTKLSKKWKQKKKDSKITTH